MVDSRSSDVQPNVLHVERVFFSNKNLYVKVFIVMLLN